jgi:hypothetical protein
LQGLQPCVTLLGLLTTPTPLILEQVSQGDRVEESLPEGARTLEPSRPLARRASAVSVSSLGSVMVGLRSPTEKPSAAADRLPPG